MFWTPMPMLETSSEPSFRRPIAAGAADLVDAMPPTSGAAARGPADMRNERRPISFLRCEAMFKRPLLWSIGHDDTSGEFHQHEGGATNEGDAGGASEAVL